MPEPEEIGRSFDPANREMTSAMIKLLQLHYERLQAESKAPTFDPLHLNPLIYLMEQPVGGFIERIRRRIDTLRIFFRYAHMLAGRWRFVTNSRMNLVNEGVPLWVDAILADERTTRLALRQFRLAAVLFLFGSSKAVEMAKASRDELSRAFGPDAK